MGGWKIFGLKWYFKVELSSSSSEDDLERKRTQARNFARFEAIAKRRGRDNKSKFVRKIFFEQKLN